MLISDTDYQLWIEDVNTLYKDNNDNNINTIT